MNIRLIELANTMGDRWFTWVLASLLDASALLILVSILWFLIRRRVAPQVGYCLFLLVPLKFLLPLSITAPTAISRWTPSVAVSTWLDGSRNRRDVERQPQVERQETLITTNQSDESDEYEVDSASQTTVLPPSARTSTTAPITPHELNRPRGWQTAQGAAPNATAGALIHSKVPSLNVSATAMLVWLLGVAFLLGRLALIQLRFRMRIKQLEPVEESRLALDLRELCRRIRMTRTVRVILSDEISAPAVWGIFQPTIILPRTIPATLSSQQLQWVLLHELAHIRRVDLAVVACQRLAAMLHFFNPAVWIANQMIHRLREYACDDLAVALSDASAADSGEAFLLILRQASRNARQLDGALGVFGLDSRASCFARVRRLMDTERTIRMGLDRRSLCGLILLAAISLPHIHAAQEVNGPDASQKSRALAETRADDNNNLRQSDKLNPGGGTVLAKDAGLFELIVVGPEGQRIPEATVELRIGPSPTAEQIIQGKFLRKGDYGAIVTADSDGRVVVKWPQTTDKCVVARIVVSGYQPYWAAWSSENEPAPVPAKATVTLAIRPPAEGLPERRNFLSGEGGGMFFVAASNAVRKEIGIDGAAAIKVQSLAEQYCEEMSRARVDQNKLVSEILNLSPEDQKKRMPEYFEKRRAETKTINEKFVAQLKAAITAEQLERLKQITWQTFGSEAWQHDAELAQVLELQKDQLQKLAAIHQEYQPKEFWLSRTGGSFARFQELDKERNSKARELLTQQQQEKLTKLEGKPFDLALLNSQVPRQQFGWFGGGIIFATAANEAVRKDLGLSEEIAAAVKKVLSDFRAAWIGTGRGFVVRRVRVAQDTERFFLDVDLPPWNSGEWMAVTAKFLPRLKDALTADQYTRLQQIDWQARGTAAYWDSEVIQALALTKEQQNKIASITNECIAKRQELFAQGGGGAGGEAREKAMSELVKEHDAQINGSLTKAQLDVFAMMRGKEFDVDELRIADLAPPPARGPGNGRPFGAGPGAGAGPGRGISPFIANGGIFSVVKNEAVQEELGLSQDAATKALAVTAEFNKAWRDAGGGFRIRLVTLANGAGRNFQEAAMPPWGTLPFPGQSEEARLQEIAKMMELWKATNTKFQAQLKDTVTADQYARLQQINRQAMGTAACYSDAEVIEALAITKDQQVKITSITNEYLAKRQELFRPGGEGDGGDLREKMNKLNLEQDSKINASLTQDQLDKFAMMKGKEFDVSQLRDAEPFRRPGLRNGGGDDDGRPK